VEKKRKEWTKYISIFLLGAALIIFYKTFDNLRSVLSAIGDFIALLTPFIIGFILAFFLYPATANLEKKLAKAKPAFLVKHKKTISILAVYFGFLAVLGVAIGFVFPRLSAGVADLIKKLPVIVNDLIAFADGLMRDGGLLEKLPLESWLAAVDFQGILSNIFMQDAWSYVEGVKGVTSAASSFLIGLVVCLYTLLERDNLFRLTRRFFGLFMKEESMAVAKAYIGHISSIFYRFFYGMMIDSLIVGIIAAIGFALFRIPYAPILGAVMMIFNMIPYFGPIIGAIPAVLIAAISQGLYPALWVALFILILQQVEGNIIAPRILGGSVGVSPFWVVFAIVVFGGLFGVWGMILGVPLLAAIRMLARDYLHDKKLDAGLGETE